MEGTPVPELLLLYKTAGSADLLPRLAVSMLGDRLREKKEQDEARLREAAGAMTVRFEELTRPISEEGAVHLASAGARLVYLGEKLGASPSILSGLRSLRPSALSGARTLTRPLSRPVRQPTTLPKGQSAPPPGPKTTAAGPYVAPTTPMPAGTSGTLRAPPPPSAAFTPPPTVVRQAAVGNAMPPPPGLEARVARIHQAESAPAGIAPHPNSAPAASVSAAPPSASPQAVQTEQAASSKPDLKSVKRQLALAGLGLGGIYLGGKALDATGQALGGGEAGPPNYGPGRLGYQVPATPNAYGYAQY